MTTLLVAVLACLLGVAAWQTVRRMRKGGGCCGEHGAKEKKTAVADRSREHYPYLLSLQIGGMTCENCARRVENALNGIDGVWAKVSIDRHCARVRCKTEPDEKRLREAVRNAGYVVTDCVKLTDR